MSGNASEPVTCFQIASIEAIVEAIVFAIAQIVAIRQQLAGSEKCPENVFTFSLFKFHFSPIFIFI